MSQFRCEEVWIPQRLGFYQVNIIKEKGNKSVPVFKRHDHNERRVSTTQDLDNFSLFHSLY